jgi:predicted methyltransferase
MSRRRTVVELDERLVDAVGAAAQRSGLSEAELYERALRRLLSDDFRDLLSEIAQDQRQAGIELSDETAERLAVEEVRALRAARQAG